MVQQPDELRRDMEDRRVAIRDTVDEIQNRVTPGRVAARGRYRARRRMARWKDNVMGQMEQTGGSMGERAGSMAESVREAPSAVERYTRGNPLAVGLIAVGAGALAASMLPETRQEREMVQRMQPKMEEMASEVGEKGREMAEEVKGTAREGASRVQETAKTAGQEMKEEARQSKEQMGGGGT